MFSSVLTGTLFGMETLFVETEVDISEGMPMFDMVGFLSYEVKEAKERVKTSLKNCGYSLPPKRITVNLSPADVKKQGSSFDLPIALSVLTALDILKKEQLEDTLVLGELSLNGMVKPVNGVLPIVLAAKKRGIKTCIVPKQNAAEGETIEGIEIIGVRQLMEVIEHLNKTKVIYSKHSDIRKILAGVQKRQPNDFDEINGQAALRRGIEVAAAGMHNILMMGPPGSGKTMVAKRIPGILPPLTMEESLEVSKIYSISGLLPKEGIITSRPFISPHHTISPNALAGGGSIPKPGAISLAHRGVLFLDELAEFNRATLEIMRQPLEDKTVHINRVQGNFIYPANFMLVAASNPCKCGYYPNKNRCTCTETDINKYLGKISQPLLDRIDICVEAAPIRYSELAEEGVNENSEQIKERVMVARNIQEKRYGEMGMIFNGELKPGNLKKFCSLGLSEERLLEMVFEKMGLSARGYHKILKVARTIADLDESMNIQKKHLSEAIGYRSMDMQYWKSTGWEGKR